MSQLTCATCQKPKATLKCGLCDCDVCKNCAQFLAEDAFSFLEKIPKELKHSIYCSSCYDQTVATEMESYNQILELAKDVNIYFKTQGKETRTLKRKEKPVKITNCPDYDEALLRLAFLAAKANYNCLIDVEMNSKKEIVNGYQKTIWSGTGIPTQVTEKQLNLSLRNPN
jgi:hypothetical protein